MGKRAKKQKSVLAKNIIARRKALGWTAMELAAQAELPYPTVRDIEAGTSGGWAATREKIAKALKCNPLDLLREGVSEPKSQALIVGIIEKLPTANEEMLAAILDLLSEEPSEKAEARARRS